VEADLWVVEGKITFVPQLDAVELDDTRTTPSVHASRWILSGLVDAHCHIGLGAGGGVTRSEAEAQALTDLRSGVTLVRDAGVPIDTAWLEGSSQAPKIIRSGRHIARPRRYLKDFGVEIEPDCLVEEVRRQASASQGWVKLVGDWIDRDGGDLAPLWPADIAAQAIRAAHEEGARVTAHCFGEESVSQLVRAGIDCIEHGCGLDSETVRIMAGEGIALVPTLDNWRIFPGIADQAQDRFPTYAAHMRALYATRAEAIGAAIAAGVQVYAGTDAGGTRSHGTILPELQALAELGGTDFALGAASWRARTWLGRPGLEEGAPADLLILDSDPSRDLNSLASPAAILLDGVPVVS
jgi:imidazolonepropionase-like amidohydrolase